MMLTTLPALCRVSLISLAYFLCEKNGVEQIVWPRPPRGDPVTLTHMPRATTLSRSRAMATKRKTRHYYCTHNLASTVSFAGHASVSERQRSWPCGQNLRVPFLRTVLPPEVEESGRAIAATARQKRSYLHHQGEFQHQLFTFRSGHDSDHGGIVRISVYRPSLSTQTLS